MKIKLVIFLASFLIIGCTKRDVKLSQNDTTKRLTKQVSSETKDINSLDDSYNNLSNNSNKAYELPELINMFLLDENDDTKEYDWNLVTSDKFPFKFEKNNFSKDYIWECDDINKFLIIRSNKSKQEYKNVGLRLYGNKNGFNRIVIPIDCVLDDKDHRYSINSILKNKDLTIKLIQGEETDTDEDIAFNLYELKFKGKKTIWFFIKSSQCGGRDHWGNDWLINCFFDKELALDYLKNYRY